MVTITASDTYFTNIDSTYAASKWEACIDQAVDKINGYARDDILPNMSGTAGSKTLTVTSGQAGFIREVAVAIYTKNKTGGLKTSSTNMGVINVSSNIDDLEALAKTAAATLREIDVSIG